MRILNENAVLTNDVIREVLGEKHPIAIGWQVLVQTYELGDNYINPDGSKSIFERPDIAKDRDAFHMAIAKVLMVGSAAYKGSTFAYWDIIPSEGDYVFIPKYEGSKEVHNGVNIQIFRDYEVLPIVPDPTLSASYHNFRGI